MFETVKSWLHRNSIELLLILFICLLPFKEAIHAPFFILLILAIRLLVKKSIDFDRSQKEFLLVVGLLVVPLLLSSITADYTWRTLEQVIRMSLYAIAGLAVLHYFRDDYNERLLLYGVAALVTFTCLDALLQFFSGQNLFGSPLGRGERVMGVFYPNLRLGHVVAHLSPFVLECIRRYVDGKPGRYWAWLLIIPLLSVLLVSGNRTSWLIMLFMLPIYSIYLIYRQQLKWWLVPGFAVLALGGLLVTMQYSESIQKRFERTMSAFTLDMEQLNYASSNRINIYEAAWEVIKENPILGVGWRGFRGASTEIGLPMEGIGHAHFYALDVLLHTGLVGFIPYLMLLALLIRLCVRNARSGNDLAFAYSLGAVMLVNPFNLHYSIYYYHSSGMFLLMLILAYVATRAKSI